MDNNKNAIQNYTEDERNDIIIQSGEQYHKMMQNGQYKELLVKFGENGKYSLSNLLYMLSQSGAVAVGTLFFITLGGVTKFVMYSRKFAGPINEFANIIHEFQSAFSAAERIFRVLDEEPEPVDCEDAVSLEKVEGRVRMQDVTFGYVPEKEILKGISLNVEKGKYNRFE